MTSTSASEEDKLTTCSRGIYFVVILVSCKTETQIRTNSMCLYDETVKRGMNPFHHHSSSWEHKNETRQEGRGWRQFMARQFMQTFYMRFQSMKEEERKVKNLWKKIRLWMKCEWSEGEEEKRHRVHEKGRKCFQLILKDMKRHNRRRLLWTGTNSGVTQTRNRFRNQESFVLGSLQVPLRRTFEENSREEELPLDSGCNERWKRELQSSKVFYRVSDESVPTLRRLWRDQPKCCISFWKSFTVSP